MDILPQLPPASVGAPLVGAHSIESPMGDKDRAGTRPAPTSSLGDVVGIFKSISTHQYAIHVNANNWPAFPGTLWQRNYNDYTEIPIDNIKFGLLF